MTSPVELIEVIRAVRSGSSGKSMSKESNGTKVSTCANSSYSGSVTIIF